MLAHPAAQALGFLTLGGLYIWYRTHPHLPAHLIGRLEVAMGGGFWLSLLMLSLNDWLLDSWTVRLAALAATTVSGLLWLGLLAWQWYTRQVEGATHSNSSRRETGPSSDSR